MSEQTKLIQRTRQDEQGFEFDGKRMYDHVITIDNLDHHYYSKNKEIVEFEAGKESTFTVEKKPTPRDKDRMVVKPVKKIPPQQFSKGFSGGKSNYSKDKNSAVITYLSVLSSVTNGLQQSTEIFNKEKVSEMVEFFYERAKSKAGESDQF